nr:unnamed protein product [Callosobruchus analis]
MGAGIAGIVEGDYRSVGKNDLICVSTSGEVRGFTTTKTLIGEENRCENDIVMELLNQKQSLLMELKQYEYNMSLNSLALDSLTLDSVTLNALTIDFLTLDSVTLDSLTFDSLILDSLTVDSLTLDSLTPDSRTLDSLLLTP